MGLLDRLRPSGVIPAERPEAAATAGALTASAWQVDLSMPGTWQFFTFGDRRWQLESWRHYDICGELRFITNWKASAVSRCRMYAAEIDENGVPGDECDDDKVRAIADGILGRTPAARAEHQRSLGLNLEITGEAFIAALAGADNATPTKAKRGKAQDPAEHDSWTIASVSEVFRRADEVMLRQGNGNDAGKPRPLVPGKDILIRCWTSHPRRAAAADSALRACLPRLRELERASQQVAASIDSRLASAGMLLLPESADYMGQAGAPPRSGDLQTRLMRVMSTALQDPASAAARVPLILKVRDDAIGKIQYIEFDFKITQEVLDIRDRAILSIARSLDVPPEVLTGTGDVSHWSAWAVSEDAIKLHVEPLLTRMADALNRGYFQPALRAAGIADPEKYTIWFDVTPLAIRPNRSDQARQLGEMGLLSDEAVRQNNGFEETDAPGDAEKLYHLAHEIIKLQPLYATDPVFAKILGLPEGIKNPTAPPPGMGGPPGMIDPNDPNADPEALLAQLEAGTAADQGGAQGEPAAMGNTPPAPPSQTASGALLVACDAAVRRALEIAGGRIVPGPGRDRYEGTPRHELHTRVIPSAEKIPGLLAGAWSQFHANVELALTSSGGMRADDPLRAAGVAGAALAMDLEAYCTLLLEKGIAHEPELLRGVLQLKRYPV